MVADSCEVVHLVPIVTCLNILPKVHPTKLLQYNILYHIITQNHTFNDGSAPYSNVFTPSLESLTETLKVSITSSTSILKFA